MSITKQGGRQWPLVAKLAFALADHGASGVAEDAIDLPAGASVIAASITIEEVYDSTTSDLFDVTGAGITLAGANGQALGTTDASAIDSTALVVNTAIQIEWTSGGGVPTTGIGFLIVEYIMDGKANEVVPA